MRFTDRQLFIKGLVGELGLPAHKFAFEMKLLYLRGIHSRPQEPLPYHLERGLQNKDADTLVRIAILRALKDLTFDGHERSEIRSIRRKIGTRAAARNPLPTIDLLSAHEWEVLKNSAYLQNRPLYEVGFWNLLHYYLKGEGFLCAHDVFGYESILGNWNAAEAIPWFLRDFGVDYYAIRAGMANISFRMGERVARYCPDFLKLKTKVTGIRRDRDGFKLALSYRRGKRFKEGSCSAACVILALPRSALQELLRNSEFDVSQRRRENIQRRLETVQVHPLFKLFLGYRRAWWMDDRCLGCQSGRAVTDLPVRQVYYYGPDSAHYGPDSAQTTTQSGLVMASYSDEHYIDFWRPLERRPGKDPYLFDGTYELKSDEREVLEAYGATEAMARKAHRQLLDLHPKMPKAHVQPPFVALMQDWRDGWHTWMAGVQPWKHMNALVQPLRGVPLFTCGEAYSNEQGWIEGALRSTELVLKRLGVPPPYWVDDKTYRANKFDGYDEYIGARPHYRRNRAKKGVGEKKRENRV